MNGIIYCRVSSKEQTEGTSLKSQELACREYAKGRDITVLKVFVERGESAKFADRTQLLELIDFVRKARGEVKVLVVWKVDRFARNVGDHFNIKATLMKYGVRIASVTEPIDSNPEGKLMETILAGFAQFDNDIRAMRSVQGMRRKIQEGIFPWGAPLGYKSPIGPREKKTAPDVPDRPLFDLLQKAWKEFATGAYTKAEIRRLLTSWGIVAKNGAPFSPQSIDHLFRNRYYAGRIIEPWSGEEYEGRHLPMVTEEEFARVQQIISRRNRSLRHNRFRPEFPLRGLIRCDCCGRKLTGSVSRGRSSRYAYYHCGNRNCERRGKAFATKPVHEDFEAFLTWVAPKPEVLEQIGSALIRAIEEGKEFEKKRAERLRSELERLDRERAELIRMRSRELIGDDDFLAQKAAIDARRFEIRGEPSEGAEIDGATLQREIEEISGPLGDLRETWTTLPESERRRFEQLLLPAGFVNGNVRTADLGLLFKLNQPSEDGDVNGVAPGYISSNRLRLEIAAFARLVKSLKMPLDPSEEAVPMNVDDGAPWDEMEPAV